MNELTKYKPSAEESLIDLYLDPNPPEKMIGEKLQKEPKKHKIDINSLVSIKPWIPTVSMVQQAFLRLPSVTQDTRDSHHVLIEHREPIHHELGVNPSTERVDSNVITFHKARQDDGSIIWLYVGPIKQ